MAPASEAAASLVQAYIGRTDNAAADVASFLGKSPMVSGSGSKPVSNYPRTSLPVGAVTVPLPARQTEGVPRHLSRFRPHSDPRVASARGAKVMPRSARQPAVPSAGRLLAGDWKPEARPPRRAASCDGASVNTPDEHALEESIRMMSACLANDGDGPLPGLMSLAQRKLGRRAAADQAREDGDVDEGSTCCSNSQGYQDCRTELSHATTPSWRSRSFPPKFLEKAAARQKARSATDAVDTPQWVYPDNAMAYAQAEMPAERRRLPGLPDEARPRRRDAPSEVTRLIDIASDVGEANAMLVDSFLNVKRQAFEIAQGGLASASGSGSYVGSASNPGPASSYLSASALSFADRQSLESSGCEMGQKWSRPAPPRGPVPDAAGGGRKGRAWKRPMSKLGSVAENGGDSDCFLDYSIKLVKAAPVKEAVIEPTQHAEDLGVNQLYISRGAAFS